MSCAVRFVLAGSLALACCTAARAARADETASTGGPPSAARAAEESSEPSSEKTAPKRLFFVVKGGGDALALFGSASFGGSLHVGLDGRVGKRAFLGVELSHVRGLTPAGRGVFLGSLTGTIAFEASERLRVRLGLEVGYLQIEDATTTAATSSLYIAPTAGAELDLVRLERGQAFFLAAQAKPMLARSETLVLSAGLGLGARL